jgi:UDP-N-acetyl-D-mannosaminuronic acid dehydrogenase
MEMEMLVSVFLILFYMEKITNMEQQFKKICIIGLGYIGLPTAALLANRGFDVLGVDINKSVVDTINQGKIHIIEPELDTFVTSAVNSKKLKAALKPSKADVFIIAVPTPFHEGYKPNIDYVLAATKSIAPFLREGNLVILESTSPVGTTEKMAITLQEEGVDIKNIFISHCPERVLPGQVMKELIENDRVVGGINDESTEKSVQFYKTFVSGEVLSTNARTAELCKLVENSYRDTNIAFANELSLICDKAGINVWELIKLANHHPRVNILRPGCGVGGHCIAVDPWFIVADYPEEAKMVKTARLVNDYKSSWVVEKVKNECLKFQQIHQREPIVACMGLAFKPDIDDLRESPALKIYMDLKEEGISCIAVEPHVKCVQGVNLKNLAEATTQADIIVFLVAHSCFKNLVISPSKKIINITGI